MPSKLGPSAWRRRCEICSSRSSTCFLTASTASATVTSGAHEDERRRHQVASRSVKWTLLDLADVLRRLPGSTAIELDEELVPHRLGEDGEEVGPVVGRHPRSRDLRHRLGRHGSTSSSCLGSSRRSKIGAASSAGSFPRMTATSSGSSSPRMSARSSAWMSSSSSFSCSGSSLRSCLRSGPRSVPSRVDAGFYSVGAGDALTCAARVGDLDDTGGLGVLSHARGYLKRRGRSDPLMDRRDRLLSMSATTEAMSWTVCSGEHLAEGSCSSVEVRGGAVGDEKLLAVRGRGRGSPCSRRPGAIVLRPGPELVLGRTPASPVPLPTGSPPGM